MKTSKLFALAVVAAIGLASIAAQAAGINLGALVSPDVAMGLSMVGAAGMINFTQEGETLTLKPTAAVASGVGYLFGVSLFGVATNAVAANANGEFLTEGVVEIGKTSALAISIGDRLFWGRLARWSTKPPRHSNVLASRYLMQPTPAPRCG